MTTQWMRVAPHTQTAPVASPPPPTDTGSARYLTADALLSYCEVRLRGLDEQVGKVFKEQQRANDDSAKLGWLQTCVAACQTHGIDGKGSAVHDLIRAYELAIHDVGRDTQLGQALFDAQQSFITKVGTNNGADLRAEMSQGDYWSKTLASNADSGLVANNVSPDEVKTMVTQLKDLQTDVNHGSEMGMITLQSLMSQRQMAIQLVTNLVQSLGEMTNKVAANIGH